MITDPVARLGLIVAAALAGSGCARVVELGPEPTTVATASPSSRASSFVGERPAAGGLEGELERRLAEVQAGLPSASGPTRAELEAERLALVVALTRVSSSFGSWQDSTLPEAEQADRLVAAAKAAIARTRADSSKRAQGDDVFTLSGELSEKQKDLEQQVRIETELTRLLAKAKDKKMGRKSERRADGRGNCAPGDPLCLELDDDGDVDLPPAETKVAGKPDSNRDGFGQGQHDFGPVAAARVAFEPTPTGVMTEIRRHFGRVSACIPPVLRQQELQLRVVVLLDASGLLRQPRVEGSELDAVTRECVADVFRTMRIDDPPGASRVLSVPLWLAANR